MQWGTKEARQAWGLHVFVSEALCVLGGESRGTVEEEEESARKNAIGRAWGTSLWLVQPPPQNSLCSASECGAARVPGEVRTSLA